MSGSIGEGLPDVRVLCPTPDPTDLIALSTRDMIAAGHPTRLTTRGVPSAAAQFGSEGRLVYGTFVGDMALDEGGPFTTLPGPVRTLRATPAGLVVAHVGGAGVYLIDTSGQSVAPPLPCIDVIGKPLIDIDASNGFLAVGGLDGVIVYQLCAPPRVVHRLPSPGRAAAVCFHPNLPVLITWDPADGTTSGSVIVFHA